MKQHIKSLPHHPKRVITLSLIVALAVGIFSYLQINKKVATPVIQENTKSDVANLSSGNLTLGFLASGRIKSVSVKAGDQVKQGQILATLDAGNTVGALAQARAALAIAQANYKKIINGATGAAIDVARASAHTAEVNLAGAASQQNLLVVNAKKNFLNSTIVARQKGDSSIAPPTIIGAYNKDVEGKIVISVYQTGDGGYFSLSGIIDGTGGRASANIETPIGDSGLFIKFSSNSSYYGTVWDIDIPNKNAANYLTNYNAYETALETKKQTIANAQAVLDQANASLAALVIAARPEDVAVAQAQVDNALGFVQIAQAAYENTIITAPTDGTVTSVTITAGQIAVPNAPAIGFISNDSN